MRKINIETIVKFLVFLVFVIFYYAMLKSGKVNLYVHPRNLPFIKLSIGVMIIISICHLLSLFKENIIKKKKRSYIIFLIPLMMTLGMESEALVPNILENPNFDIKEEISLKNKEIDHSGHDHNMDVHEGSNELDINNKRVVVEDKNYMFFLNKVYNDYDEYLGKEIEITGFIYRDESFKRNELVLVRMMMVCCSADTKIVGLICNHQANLKFDNETWVRVVGVLQEKDPFEGAILNIISLEKIDKPKKEYVYPY